MTLVRQQAGSGFWFGWVLASTLIVPLGATMFSTFAGDLAEVTEGLLPAYRLVGPVLFLLILGFLIGAPLALAQKVLLRAIDRGAAEWWAAYSLAGWTGGAALTGAILGALQSLDGSAAIYFIFYLLGIAAWPLMIGVSQWAILREYVDRAAWWVWVSLIGWGGGIIAGGFFTLSISYPFFGPPLLGITLPGIYLGTGAGLVSGAMTGGLLVWIFGEQPA